MLFLSSLYEQVYFFLERGGDVLYALMIVIFLLWLFIVERFVFLGVFYRRLQNNLVQQWVSRDDKASWHAHRIREDLLAQNKLALTANLSTIKMLVGLCPLFGLLGTVTGMIDVFDVMAFFGSGSPKAMAAGISKATIPTMAGMVGALTGVFAQSLLDRWVEKQKNKAEQALSFDA